MLRSYNFIFTAILLCCLSQLLSQDYQVLVSSRGENAVKLYDIDGNYLSDFVSPGDGGLNTTEDILFHPDGSVLVTGFNNSSIKRYNGISGEYIQDFSNGYTLNGPSKMAVGPDNYIYVTQWGSNNVKTVRFDMDGNFVDEFTSIVTPRGLGQEWDADGNYYVAIFSQSGSNGTVEKFDSSGNFLETFIDSDVLQGPTSIWWDDNGDMLVEDWTAGVVRRYDSEGNYLNNFISGMANPEGISFLPNGNILIGDWGSDNVRMFSNTGSSLGVFASGNGLTDPNSVKVRESPLVSIEEIQNETIQIHPNPNNGNFRFQFEMAEEFRIYNSYGQLVFIKQLDPSQSSFFYSNHTLSPGTYIVEVTGINSVGREFLVISN